MHKQKFEHAWLYVNSDNKDVNRLLYTLILHGRHKKHTCISRFIYYCIHKRKTTLVNMTVDAYYSHICLACLAWRDIHVV